MKQSDIYVILPSYNEHVRIAPVVKAVRKQGFEHVVVVDDGSRDDTSEVARKAGAIVLCHIVNLGKGGAMKTGADFALEQGAKAIIFMDSDGQHRPEELPLFVAKLEKGYDIVFGSRKRTKHMPAIRRLGNFVITTVVRMFYRMDLRDVTSGYRAMTMKAYRKIRWDSRDYSVESEMIARAGKNNLKYTEFEIATIYHDKYKGMTIFAGLRIVWQLIWWRMTH
jgi:UDP-N-acetylglucosamine---dolichyl-phosphate N-acetylglucosaminyltransferase